jgi:hypothetical protein
MSGTKSAPEFVLDAARFVTGAVVVGFASDAYAKDITAPESIALTFVLTAGAVMLVPAIIMLMELGKYEPGWKDEAKYYQVYMSNFLLLGTAFYAGIETTSDQSIGDALAKPPAGLFLGVAILKVTEFIVELLGAFGAIQYSPDLQSGGDTGLEDKAKDGWVSLGFALALAIVGGFGVDCNPVPQTALNADNKTYVLKDNATGLDLYTGECEKDDAWSDFIWVGFVSLITALGFTLVVQGILLQGKSRKAFFGANAASAVLGHVALSALSLELGRNFYEQFYVEQFLSANFYYFASILFGFFGVVVLEGQEDMRETATVTRASMRQTAMILGGIFAGIFGTAALWGADILYTKLESDASANKLALAVYAVIAVLVLSLHIVFSKVVEMVLDPELRMLGICGGTESAKGVNEVATKRSEATLIFVLAAAVFFGVQDSEVSLALLFVGGATLRTVGFFIREGLGEGSVVALKYVWDENTTTLKPDQPGVLFGSLSLLVSGILWTVYIFRDGPNDPVPEGSAALVTWEFLAWILILAHVLLTALGMIEALGGFHAARIPMLRFSVSSFVLAILAASLGEHALESGDYKLIAPTLLTYALYDGLSGQKF